MEHNVKRNKKYFEQKKTSPLMIVGIVFAAIAVFLLLFPQILGEIGVYVTLVASVAAIVLILVASSKTVRDDEIELQRTQLMRELDHSLTQICRLSKGEREEERHLVCGYDFSKPDVHFFRTEEGGDRCQYIYAGAFMVTNIHFFVVLKEYNLWEEEEPKETVWSFQNRTMRGFELKRETFKFGERSVEMVFGDIFDDAGKHILLPLQNDAEIDNVTNRLNKKFKRNAQSAF